MSNNRYMMRGVSAAKEDVHNAIKNIDKGIFPQAFCKIIPDILGGDLSTATSCMPTALEQNQAWHTCTGKKRVTSPYGKVSHRMQS